MNLTSIPALQDNYIWTLTDDEGKCLIVDPGEAQPVLEKIQANDWQPVAILLTHHHNDHVGGVKTLCEHFPEIAVYGPQETADKGAKTCVREGDNVDVLGLSFAVIATPGHTLGHISYYSAPYLFVEIRCSQVVADGFSKAPLSKCTNPFKSLIRSRKTH